MSEAVENNKTILGITTSHGFQESVPNADIAEYASDDKEKGTIEERLTNLGFSEGTIKYRRETLDGKYSTQLTKGTVQKQGKICIANKSNGSEFIRYTLSDLSASGDYLVIEIPKEFAPKEKIMFLARTNLYYSNTTPCDVFLATLDTDGLIKIYLGVSSGLEWVEFYNIGWETN